MSAIEVFRGTGVRGVAMSGGICPVASTERASDVHFPEDISPRRGDNILSVSHESAQRLFCTFVLAPYCSENVLRQVN